MNAYKVVEHFSRRSTNWGLYCKWSERNTHNFIKEWEPFLPQYIPGTIVKAIEGSQGIYCFREKKYAEEFKDSLIGDYIPFSTTLRFDIIKVRGIGEPNHSPLIFTGCGSTPGYLTRLLLPYMEHIYQDVAPVGAITFPAVEVIG